jgi:hypothetical protein
MPIVRTKSLIYLKSANKRQAWSGRSIPNYLVNPDSSERRLSSYEVHTPFRSRCCARKADAVHAKRLVLGPAERKSQIPGTKATNKFQYPGFQIPNEKGCRGWSLEFGVYLLFGVWNFCASSIDNKLSQAAP